MTGLIWFVQIVHYPLMGLVGVEQFPAYERRHTLRTGVVVGPLMLVEALTAVALVVAVRGEPPATPAWIGVGLLTIIWGSTLFVQAPCHRRLETGFSPAVHGRLVATNWIRTAAWSARSVIALILLTA